MGVSRCGFRRYSLPVLAFTRIAMCSLSNRSANSLMVIALRPASRSAAGSSPLRAAATMVMARAFAYQALSKGIRPNQWDLEPQEHSRMGVLIPPLPEQQAIAAFLDRETAKIDGLIEEQRRLIALLAEKRQATISHAVTRGLNPSARLKPSGVDWLGDVPEGWEVVRLRHVASFNPSKSEVSHRSRHDEISFLPMEAIGEDGSLDLSRTRPIEEVETGYTYLRDGDVAFAKITPCFENGKGAVMRDLVGGIAFGTTELTVLRPFNEKLSAEFLGCILASAEFRKLGEGHMYGAGGQKRVPDDFARDFRIVLPPLSEQGAIVEYLQDAKSRFDLLSEAALSSINLMQERRAALISAAVTGKIDVCEAQASSVQIRKSLSVRVLLGGVIIAALGRHASMGRMLVQKHLFMAEAHAGVSELQGRYDRQAAGPYDVDLQRRVEDDLVAAGLLRVAQDGGPGSRVEYELLGDAAALRAELAVALGDRMARFDDTFRQLADLSKLGIEAVATLYAAWNDFLMDGKNPSRDDIIREVLENWHDEKRDKFTKSDLAIWLDWMDRHQVQPKGTGPKTQTGRLFP